MERLLKMKSDYRIKTTDTIVQDVIKKIDARSEVGMKKYGKAMIEEVMNGEKDLYAFMTDVQEELMDALLYLESAKRCLQIEIEEAALKQMDPFADQQYSEYEDS
jgi:hypothetical protein